MEKLFTITIFTEDLIGLLNRVSIIFTRRHINISSITASESEIKGVHRYTIVARTTEEQVRKVVSQIEKLIEVLRASYYTDEEIIHQEIALYKVSIKALSNNNNIEEIVRNNNARILTIEPKYFVVEKTGYKKETQELFNLLEPYGVLQFVRSGRVAITKQIKELTNYLKDIEEASRHSNRIRNWKLKNVN